MQHEERKAEHPERVLGAQFPIQHVHVEPFRETAHRGGGELTGNRVNVGQVVPRLIERAPAVEDEPAAGPRGRASRVRYSR
jgi:hypothetical protein